MSDLISRALLSGLGFASLTKDAVKKAAEDFINQSKLSEEEGRRLVKEVQRRSSKAQKDFQKTVESTVHKVLKGLNLESGNGRAHHTAAKHAGRKRARRKGIKPAVARVAEKVARKARARRRPAKTTR